MYKWLAFIKSKVRKSTCCCLSGTELHEHTVTLFLSDLRKSQNIALKDTSDIFFSKDQHNEINCVFPSQIYDEKMKSSRRNKKNYEELNSNVLRQSLQRSSELQKLVKVGYVARIHQTINFLQKFSLYFSKKIKKQKIVFWMNEMYPFHR